jgi:ASC-1-like (ASCH) protein
MIRLKKEFFRQITSGRKTLEVRVAQRNLRSIQPGDMIRFVSGKEEQIVSVQAVRRYASHIQMIEAEDHTKIAPHLASQDELLAVLQQMYPPEKEQLGVIVLQIKRDSIS